MKIPSICLKKEIIKEKYSAYGYEKTDKYMVKREQVQYMVKRKILRICPKWECSENDQIKKYAQYIDKAKKLSMCPDEKYSVYGKIERYSVNEQRKRFSI